MSEEDSPKLSSNASPYTIRQVEVLSDLKATIALIEEYTAWIGIDLSYQNYEEELASMPGKYSPSSGGCLLIALSTATQEPLGCAALRALSVAGNDAACEMKRLYVAPAGRRLGLGKALALEVIDRAREHGYSQMYLDTLPFMEAAIKLYESLGFRRVEKYYDSAPPGTVFLAKDLVS